MPREKREKGAWQKEEKRKRRVLCLPCFGWSERERETDNRFSMVRQSPRLLKDVNDAEEAELRRLEGRVDDVPVVDGTVDSDADNGGGGDTAVVVQVSGGKSNKTGFALARAKLSEEKKEYRDGKRKP